MDYFKILYFFVLISISLSTKTKKDKPKRVPKMVVFDLDFTLWPFWVDVDAIPPFHKDEVGDIVDVNGKQVKCFEEAPEVLKYLHDKQIRIGAFSRVYDSDGAKQLIDLFGWSKYITYVHLFKGTGEHTSYINQTNLEALAKEANVDLKDILFIDDIYRNIVDFERLEVASYLASRGVTMEVIRLGLRKFADFSERITEENEIRREKKKNATRV